MSTTSVLETTSARHNFSGGPGALPDVVLDQAACAIREVPEVGLSVLGISHRSTWFRDVVDEAEANVRALLGLGADYRVLFLQGGGTLQFSMVPMHLLRRRPGAPGEYVVAGYWSQKAIAEAGFHGPVRAIWHGEETRFTRVPRAAEIAASADAAYLHYVSNETVEGLQFHHVPDAGGAPRVCDMSSDFLSRPHDVSAFDLVYAHAQKNLGPAGVTVVLAHERVLRDPPRDVPAMLRYATHAEHGSIYNTPPVFAIYVTMLVTRWLRDEIGGLERMAAINAEKAARLYRFLDAHPDFFETHAEPSSRSLMNVAFRLRQPSLTAALLRTAEARGLHGLEGHRSLGGLRASLYNAVTLASVDALTSFLAEFQHDHRDRG